MKKEEFLIEYSYTQVALSFLSGTHYYDPFSNHYNIRGFQFN